MKSKYREPVIYIFIIFLQIMMAFFWANNKVNYHIDEMYSMGYASSLTGLGDRGQYITTSPDFEFNKWIKNADLKKHLVVSNKESFFKVPVIDQLRLFLFERNYIVLLNIVESFFEFEYASPIPGLILNLVLFVCSEIVLLSLLKKLEFDERIKCLAVIMYGFSGYIISTIIYIRFYMLVILLMLFVVNLFYDLWVADTWKRIIILEASIIFLTYLSYMNSELTIPFFASFLAGFVLMSLFYKKSKQVTSCLIICILALLYLAFKSSLLGILIHPDQYSDEYGVYRNASIAIRSLDVGFLKDFFLWVKGLIDSLYFGAAWIFYLMFGVVTVAIIIAYEKKEDIKPETTLIKPRCVTVIAFSIWALALLMSSIIGTGRSICMLVLCAIALLGLNEMVGFKRFIEGRKLSEKTTFVIILLIETILYTVFVALCQFAIWRYYCFGFVSFTIVFWYTIDRVVMHTDLKSISRSIITVLSVFVAICIFTPFVKRNIENIYGDEKEFVNRIRDNYGLDVILITAYDEGEISRHDTYDCINLISSDTRIYIADVAEYDYDQTPHPQEFLLWTHEGRDITGVLSELKLHGYSIDELGEDHCSKAFICRL